MKSTDLENPRIHGNPPLSVVVLHGGPGALGGMSHVASELADDWGGFQKIEPMIDDQYGIRCEA